MKKIYLFCFGIFLYCCVYSTLTFIFLPLSEDWLRSVYEVKHQIAAKSGGKKIIITGGSSSLFGFNGDVIEKNIKVPHKVLNLATHAGLPINYHIDQAINVARQGDIVIMPLEFDYYYQESPQQNNWYLQNILSWDTNYKKFISPINFIFTSLQTSPSSFISSILKRIKKTESDIYTSKNLNQWGDFCINRSSQLKKQQYSYLPQSFTISDFFLSEIQRANKVLQSKGAKLILIFPPTIQNPSLNKREMQKATAEIKSKLYPINIEILGEIQDFNLSQSLFFDTQYHLNCSGAIKRSERFVEIFNRWITQTPQDN